VFVVNEAVETGHEAWRTNKAFQPRLDAPSYPHQQHQGDRVSRGQNQHVHCPRGDDDVLRLDVAADDAGSVGFGQRLRGPYADLQQYAWGQRSLPDPLGQNLAVMYCITMKTRPSSSSTSWMEHILGWSSAAAALASLISR